MFFPLVDSLCMQANTISGRRSVAVLRSSRWSSPWASALAWSCSSSSARFRARVNAVAVMRASAQAESWENAVLASFVIDAPVRQLPPVAQLVYSLCTQALACDWAAAQALNDLYLENLGH